VSVPPEQEEGAAFLRGLAGRDPIETHISAVFVGPDTAYKLKKAVRLPFLDFSTLAARERFARRELALNQPAAPALYRDVLPMVRRPDGQLALGGAGEPLDWVLRMAPVAEGDFLDQVAARGALTPALLDRVADAVAAYHHALPPRFDIDQTAALRRIADGNASSARAAGLPDAPVAEWHRRTLAAIGARAGLFAGRAWSGKVSRGHGDLHLGNLCLWRGEPLLFDALEFDDALATLDVGYDLAFLLMDLEHRVGRAAANRALNRYLGRSGDWSLAGTLVPFLSFRAMVRAHIEAARGRAGEAAAYLRAVADYLASPPNMVVAVGGLPGVGKTSLARALAPELGPAPGAVVVRSDEIRKRLHRLAPELRAPAWSYGPAMNGLVGAELVRAGCVLAMHGHSVILDATFLDPHDRARTERAMAATGVPFVGIWLDAPLPELEARIAARARDASDATIAVLRRAAEHHARAPDWAAVDARDDAAALAAARRTVRERCTALRRRAKI
jgi:aminoglycoside phosphotransferase family enzyme/predicted kinase